MSQIRVSNLTFNYDTNYENIFENVSFEIDTDWKIGFIGRNGRGKTTFSKLLQGEYKYSGSISSAVSFDYFPFTVDMGKNTLLVIKNIILAKLNFNPNLIDKDLSELSAGQKKKVLIAKSLSEKANIYIWDEPLNYIDVLSRMQIEKLLLKYKPTMIFVEHDYMFNENIATKVVQL